MTGRKTLLIITLSGAIILGILFQFFKPDEVWHLWNVPTMDPGFKDLRDVLVGIESSQPGKNISTDPFGLVGGYPKIWAMLGQLGISSRDTNWLATAIFCLFGVSLFFFARDYDSYTALWMSALVFSPAAMLGYERANLDLVIFMILSSAIAIDQSSRFLSVGLVSLAAMLKVYPIVGFAYLLKESRNKFLLWSGIGLGIFIIYAISISHALKGIVNYIPKGSFFDYGTEVIGFRIYEISSSRLLSNVGVLLAYFTVYLLIMVMLYLSHIFPKCSIENDHRFIDSFRLGAVIYIGTFVEGNSFNYRLIFLLFSIPQIIIWMDSSTPVRFGARVALTSLMASCWGMLLLRILPVDLAFGLDELANWVLFVGLLYLFFVSLPDWLAREIDKFFGRYQFLSKKVATEPISNNSS